MIAAGAFVLALSAASVAEPPNVESYRCASRSARKLVSVSDVYEAYQRQSVEIVKAGLRNDASRVRAAVAPGAKFMIEYGDVGMNADKDGPDGVPRFVEILGPTSFEFTTHFLGPISISPCGQIDVDVVFAGPGADATKVTFKFNRGLLEEAIGYRGTMTRGTLEASR